MRYPIFVFDRDGHLVRIESPGGLTILEPDDVRWPDGYSAFDSTARVIELASATDGDREVVEIASAGSDPDEPAFRRAIASAVNLEPLPDGLDPMIAPVRDLVGAVREADDDPGDGPGVPLAVRIPIGVAAGGIAYLVAGIWAGTLVSAGIGAVAGVVTAFPRALGAALDNSPWP